MMISQEVISICGSGRVKTLLDHDICITLKWLRFIKGQLSRFQNLPFQNHPSYVLYFQIHNIKIFWRIKVLISSLIKMYILLCIFIIDLSVCYQTKDMVNLSENVDDHVYPLCQDSSMHSTIDSSLYRQRVIYTWFICNTKI